VAPTRYYSDLASLGVFHNRLNSYCVLTLIHHYELAGHPVTR